MHRIIAPLFGAVMLIGALAFSAETSNARRMVRAGWTTEAAGGCCEWEVRLGAALGVAPLGTGVVAIVVM